MEKLRHTYRLVIMNEETFEEVGSYKLTMLNFYIFLSTIAVTGAVLMGLLIIFTPIRRYIPGYGDVREHEELLRLNEQIEEMETELSRYRLYTESFRKMLVNEVETVPAEPEEASEIPDSLLNVTRIKEEESNQALW